jgi:RNA polymerase sigma-70 factor (family 1)
MQQELEQAYTEYYPLLYSLSAKIVTSHEDREEIIHNVFLKLWNQHEQLIIDSSLKAYLCKSVINLSLNLIKRNQNIQGHHKQILAQSEEHFYDYQVEKKEKIQLVRQEIEKLPDQCKLVFKLSRYEDMSQQEIANHLNISIKTVKNHIGKALKTLHENLRSADYFKDFIILLSFVKIFFTE